MDITKEVLKKAKELGCDMAGIAPVERFKNAPLRMSPKGLLPSAMSVIVVGIHHLDASVELGGEPTPHDMNAYGNQSSVINPKLDDISFLLARFLEDRGHTALPITASNIWRYHAYKDLKVDFAPDLVHRYAAVAAGLGEIGWSGLFLTPEFGPRQRIVSVITDAELKPTPMYNGPALCDRCMECVKHCPTDAFRKEVKKINEIEIGGKTFKFPDTNKWRCSWAENFGLNLALKIPEKIDEAVILEHMEKYGFFMGEEGCCLKFCMVPEKRYYDMNYCRAPKRKKKPSVSGGDAWKEIKSICARNGIEVCAVSAADSLRKSGTANPELHLPDAASVISIGMRISPEGAGNDEISWEEHRILGYTAFDIAHYLDVKGYSAITGTKMNDILAAQENSIYESDMILATILTNAKVRPAVFRHAAKEKRKIGKTELKEICREAGADMVGTFNTERFAKFKKNFEKAVKIPDERKAVRDRGWMYGKYVPEIYTEPLSLKTPEDRLKNARSVIVLGLHFPHSTVDTAKVTPAETIGPYVFAQVESYVLLKDIALKVVKYLNYHGYRAVFTNDLTGLASKVIMNSRGGLTDLTANLYPAMLAGLAYPGMHGYPLTKEYGTRQRFIAVVTDCPLGNDPVLPEPYACGKCRKPCIASCPTSAIKGKSVKMKIENKTFHLPSIDCFSCDWARRYAMSGKEGPQYYGLERDLPVPKKKEAGEIVKAINKVEWGVQKRHINVCEECIRVCTEKGGKS